MSWIEKHGQGIILSVCINGTGIIEFHSGPEFDRNWLHKKYKNQKLRSDTELIYFAEQFDYTLASEYFVPPSSIPSHKLTAERKK